MKINSSHLEAFYAIARHLNFTKAAETLHVTQSALSQRIAKLEEDLETTLFIRDRATIRLTEMAEELLRFCQTHEMAEIELLEKLKSSNLNFAGTVRVGGFSSVNRFLVIPALSKLMTNNPRLSIFVITREIRELEKLLKSAEVDYIITNRKSESGDIESLFLGFEDNVLVRSRKHAESNIFLDHDEADPVTKSYFRQNKLNTKPPTMRYLDDVYGLIDGVKNGYGKAVLPKHLIENEKTLEIIDPQRLLQVAVYLQFYIQPFYRKVHKEIVGLIRDYFHKVLRQEK